MLLLLSHVMQEDLSQILIRARVRALFVPINRLKLLSKRINGPFHVQRLCRQSGAFFVQHTVKGLGGFTNESSLSSKLQS